MLFAWYLQHENERRDRGERDEIIDCIENPNANKRNGSYPTVEAAREDKGDEWSGFRYTL